jgi:hypothetical protein
MAASIHTLKARLKHGPALSRELRADYTLDAAGLAPRKLRPEVIRKIKSELERLELYGDHKARDFAKQMWSDHPELLEEN